MLPDQVSNPGPLTYESGTLPIALRGPAPRYGKLCWLICNLIYVSYVRMKVLLDIWSWHRETLPCESGILGYLQYFQYFKHTVIFASG